MLKLIPLGGLGEIGLNMMVLEYGDYLLVIDAGLMFPEEYMPGVDVVIPDFQYLKENRERVRSVILTHGHEDHIGAMPFFLKEFKIPVFGTSFTIELLKEKLLEHGLLDEAILEKIRGGDVIRLGPFLVEFIRVNHSIVDGVGLAIDTPEGIIVHSGDFKVDQTPVNGQFTDVVRFAHYGERGVLALLSDSTNVEREGFTLSESEVTRTLRELFQSCGGRVIVAVFASNITRIQEIIDLALAHDRKIVFSGKSMKTNVRIAREEGHIRMPDNAEVSEQALDSLPDNRVAMITTGSQGEPMSALTRMAQDRHKSIKIKKGDTVILSSRFIPGNERAITTIINSLYRMGAEVVYEKVSDIHSSGHAYQEELKLMVNLVRPKFFVPVHGEYRHLVKHTRLAADTGMAPDRCLLAEDGTGIGFAKGEAHFLEPVPSGRILVDGKGVGDVGDLVLRDRRRLSGDGMVIALLAVDEQTGDIIYGPDLISRGFVFEDQGGFILEDAKCVILEIFDEIEKPAQVDWGEIGLDVKKRLKRFFYKIIERRPLILPIIIPI
ncbi:MAG: ribonuclease J [Deltaproteobacteria bacterium]|nr:ribonuclease J [Deltaproteobacteria bacterium]